MDDMDGIPAHPARPADWSRRHFLQTAGAGLLAAAAMGSAAWLTAAGDSAAGSDAAGWLMRPPQGRLPRWRGFNLQDMYDHLSSGDFQEEDFRWISEWGFDFVRLPLYYPFWTDETDAFRILDQRLEKLDRAVEMGRKYGLHVMLNLHKAPGYSIDSTFHDPFFGNLWKDPTAQKALVFHWRTLARRYRAVPAEALSFDPVNEPPWADDSRMSEADYIRVMESVLRAVRTESPDRPVIFDGTGAGTQPVAEFSIRHWPQSFRSYAPGPLTHYKASWSSYLEGPEPDWPLTNWGAERWDRKRLEAYFAPWLSMADRGLGVHCSEGGAYRFTPHDVVLGWMRDVLEILAPHRIGFALWEFRGGFGVLDSQRADVAYEDWHGHPLDRKMLQLLQEFR